MCVEYGIQIICYDGLTDRRQCPGTARKPCCAARYIKLIKSRILTSMCAVSILKCQNVEMNKLHVCGIVEYKSTIICYDGLTL